MKILLSITILLFFGTASICQKLYFPLSNFADSATLAKNIPSLAKQVISQYKDADKGNYYYNLCRLQIIIQDYPAAVKMLDTSSRFYRSDTTLAKAIGFHYRIYSLAADACKKDSSKSFRSIYSEIFTRLYKSLSDQGAFIADNSFTYGANDKKPLEESIDIQKKSGEDSIGLKDAVTLCRNWCIWLVYANTLKSGNELTTKLGAKKYIKLHKWQLLDYQQDSVYGTSVNRAYKELLKGKKSHPVIVAVLDAGVDITQEDLQGHIWTNKKEIPGNGIDDDKNGYVDDIHGWNFLGGKDGKMMDATSSEADREYARLLPEYRQIKDSSQWSTNKQYQYFLRVKKKHLEDSTVRNRYNNILEPEYVRQLASADSFLQKATQKQLIYYKDVEFFQPKDSLADATKKLILNFYNYSDRKDKSISLDSYVSELINDPNELRKEIVGDNPFDINDRNYGNNIVGDEYADHGTHCSGIISAIRDNGIGMDGIADDVLIMPVRAVDTDQYGDEMDKDIALGIRYAVDNGAKIISMSFGKQFSPQKQWVDDAVKYAEKKGVLLVHAAMNESTNNDSTDAYPNPDFLHSLSRAKNFITVGAISIDTGFALPAFFSDYGQKEVDVFAPGVAIYSSVIGNKYDSYSGTSMATPVVAGIAALILEYYPGLTAEQVKNIIMRSVTSLKGKMVYKPGTKEKVDFATLCVSGGVVNAYKALQLAADITSHKK